MYACLALYHTMNIRQLIGITDFAVRYFRRPEINPLLHLV